MISGHELPFSREEHERRIDLAQRDLTMRGMAGALLFDPENVFWLTGYQTIGYFTFQCLYLPTLGRPTLVSRKVNAALAAVNPLIGRFVEIPDTADPVDILVKSLGNAVGDGGAIGLETKAWYLTVHDHRRLADEVPAQLEDWNGVIERMRLDKSGRGDRAHAPRGSGRRSGSRSSPRGSSPRKNRKRSRGRHV